MPGRSYAGHPLDALNRRRSGRPLVASWRSPMVGGTTPGREALRRSARLPRSPPVCRELVILGKADTCTRSHQWRAASNSRWLPIQIRPWVAGDPVPEPRPELSIHRLEPTQPSARTARTPRGPPASSTAGSRVRVSSSAQKIPTIPAGAEEPVGIEIGRQQTGQAQHHGSAGSQNRRRRLPQGNPHRVRQPFHARAVLRDSGRSARARSRCLRRTRGSP